MLFTTVTRKKTKSERGPTPPHSPPPRPALGMSKMHRLCKVNVIKWDTRCNANARGNAKDLSSWDKTHKISAPENLLWETYTYTEYRKSPSLVFHIVLSALYRCIRLLKVTNASYIFTIGIGKNSLFADFDILSVIPRRSYSGNGQIFKVRIAKMSGIQT